MWHENFYPKKLIYKKIKKIMNKHIKLFESFSEYDAISKFINVLDEPRQSPDGFLLPSSEIDFWRFERAGAGEGLKKILENPEIVNSPEVAKLMKDMLIDTIEIEGDTVIVSYLPMSKNQWVNQNFGDYVDDEGNEISYEDYLENF